MMGGGEEGSGESAKKSELRREVKARRIRGERRSEANRRVFWGDMPRLYCGTSADLCGDAER